MSTDPKHAWVRFNIFSVALQYGVIELNNKHGPKPDSNYYKLTDFTQYWCHHVKTRKPHNIEVFIHICHKKNFVFIWKFVCDKFCKFPKDIVNLVYYCAVICYLLKFPSFNWFSALPNIFSNLRNVRVAYVCELCKYLCFRNRWNFVYVLSKLRALKK